MSRLNLSEWALHHRALVAFSMVLLLLCGVQGYRTIHQREDPDFSFRVMVVRTLYPGATAQEVADQVTDVVEKKLQDLPSLDYLRSYSKPGESVIFVTPRQDLPRDELANIWYQTRKKVGDARLSLPRGVVGPFFNDEFGDTYAVLYAFSGEGFSNRELKDVVDDVRQQLLRVSNVEKAELIGVQDERIYVEFSESKLAQLGLDAQSIGTALQAQNAIAPAGTITTTRVDLPLRVDGSFRTLDDVRNLRLRVDGSTLRVGDIATVRRDYIDPPESKIRFNGREVIGLGIVPNTSADVVQLGKSLDAALARIEPSLPVGIDVERVANQPRVIRTAIGEFTRTFAEALAVVLIVSFASLGLRAGGVVAITVPLVLAGTVLVMLVAGIELQRISLGALVLALGILVDDAMIIIEMMAHKLQEGVERLHAASFAYTATAFPMLTGTLISVVGFLPVGLARSQAGEYTGSIFWVIAIALLLSWVGAVLFTPLLGYALLPKQVKGPRAVFDTPFYNRLRSWVDWSVAHRRLVLIGTLALFTAGVFAFVNVPRQFFPLSNRAEILVDLWHPEGTSITETEAAAKHLERVLADDPGVVSYATYIGAGSPRFFLLLVQQLTTVNLSETVVMTRSTKVREEVMGRLRDRFATEFPGVRGRVQRLNVGPPLEYPVEYRVRGPDTRTVRAIAEEVADVMRKNPSVVEVNDDWRERIVAADLVVDQDRARALEVSSHSIANALQAHFSGLTVGQFREANRLIPIVWRGTVAERSRFDALGAIYVRSATGQSVPLAQVVRFESRFEDGVIWHRDRFPTVTVRCDAASGVQGPDLMRDLTRALRPLKERLPPGYFIEEGASNEASAIAQGSIFVWLPLVAVITLLLLMVQLQSLSRTLLVFSTAPLGIIGAAFALLVFGAPFGFVALLGLIALAGLIMRNTVILVDQIDRDEKDGRDTWSAIVESTVRRFRPIMLTASAAVLAMIPLSRSDFFGPQAITILGGLMIATVLTVFYVPALYAAWFRVRRSGTGPISTGESVAPQRTASWRDWLTLGWRRS
jgi:multidrug efflux pump